MSPITVRRLGPLPEFMDQTGDQGVVAITTPIGGKAWLVCDYTLARQVLADQRFSRAESVKDDAPQIFDAEPVPDSMMSMDGSDHARLRRVVTGAFTSGRVAALTPSIERIADKHLDAMAVAGPGTDLISTLATPLPLEVLCTLMGVPKQDHSLFGDWVDVLFDISVHSLREKARRRLEITAYMADLLKHKQRWPKEDLLTDMISAYDQDALSMGELLTLGLTLLMAGYETTVGQIGLSMHSLLTSDRIGYEDLLRRPETLNATIEELLRLTPATPLAFPRIAVEPMRLGSVDVQAGDVILVSLLHGNRDAGSFPEPTSMNPDERRAVHLTFGHGVHRCLGAPLARVQLRIVLDRLLHRFPTLRLADAPDAVAWKAGLSIRGLSRLLVEW